MNREKALETLREWIDRCLDIKPKLEEIRDNLRGLVNDPEGFYQYFDDNVVGFWDSSYDDFGYNAWKPVSEALGYLTGVENYADTDHNLVGMFSWGGEWLNALKDMNDYMDYKSPEKYVSEFLDSDEIDTLNRSIKYISNFEQDYKRIEEYSEINFYSKAVTVSGKNEDVLILDEPEDFIDAMQKIVDDRSYYTVKFPDGSKGRVGMTSASLVLQIYEQVNSRTQDKIIEVVNKRGYDSVGVILSVLNSGGKKSGWGNYRYMMNQNNRSGESVELVVRNDEAYTQDFTMEIVDAERDEDTQADRYIIGVDLDGDKRDYTVYHWVDDGVYEAEELGVHRTSTENPFEPVAQIVYNIR